MQLPRPIPRHADGRRASRARGNDPGGIHDRRFETPSREAVQDTLGSFATVNALGCLIVRTTRGASILACLAAAALAGTLSAQAPQAPARRSVERLADSLVARVVRPRLEPDEELVDSQVFVGPFGPSPRTIFALVKHRYGSADNEDTGPRVGLWAVALYDSAGSQRRSPVEILDAAPQQVAAVMFENVDEDASLEPVVIARYGDTAPFFFTAVLDWADQGVVTGLRHLAVESRLVGLQTAAEVRRVLRARRAATPDANALGDDYCRSGEELLFGFVTAGAKSIGLCRTGSGGLVYRFGAAGRVEMAFPSDSGGPGSRFTISYYSRPGGAENLGMEEGDLSFTNRGFEYHVYYTWDATAQRSSCGVRVRNVQTRRNTEVPGISCRGDISRLQGVEGVREP